MESRAGFLLLKEEQKLEREMNGYMNWICKAGETIIFIKKGIFMIIVKLGHDDAILLYFQVKAMKKL